MKIAPHCEFPGIKKFILKAYLRGDTTRSYCLLDALTHFLESRHRIILKHLSTSLKHTGDLYEILRNPLILKYFKYYRNRVLKTGKLNLFIFNRFKMDIITKLNIKFK